MPHALLLKYPGTNCDVETERALRAAGFSTQIQPIATATPEHVAKSQLVVLGGGFSYGDYVTSGRLAQLETERFLGDALQRHHAGGGMLLGICNGFQALIKLGLVPYGKIVNIQENDPTLTFNTIGRHISQMAYTRVTSTKSPWLAGTRAGEMFAVPISHGEGRFVADEATLRRLAENGQIATQYVDPDGNVATDMPFNPNGSVWAVEGITSPDGRVLGKMGHCERKGENLYKNVPFNKDMQIFESGVKYFK